MEEPGFRIGSKYPRNFYDYKNTVTSLEVDTTYYVALFCTRWYKETFYEICRDMGDDYPLPTISIVQTDKPLMCISMGHNVQWTEKRPMQLSYEDCVTLYDNLLKAYKKRIDEIVARVRKAGSF